MSDTVAKYALLLTAISRKGTCSHGVFLGPLLGNLIEPSSVGFVQMGSLRNEWIIWIRICQKRAYGKQNFGNSERRAPVVLQDVQTDASVFIDVRMIHSSGELQLGLKFQIISVDQCAQNTRNTQQSPA